MYVTVIPHDFFRELADTVLRSASSTHMVLESKYCHDSFAGRTILLDYPRHASPMSSDTQVLGPELTRNLYRHQCILLL